MIQEEVFQHSNLTYLYKSVPHRNFLFLFLFNTNTNAKIYFFRRNLEGMRYEHINFPVINQLTSLSSIAYDKFYYCSMTPMIKNCMPNTDG